MPLAEEHTCRALDGHQGLLLSHRVLAPVCGPLLLRRLQAARLLRAGALVALTKTHTEHRKVSG